MPPPSNSTDRQPTDRRDVYGGRPCQLCGRITKRGTTEHHLIPRTCHRNKWFRKRFTREQMQETISLCHDCHRAVHRFVPKEKDLGRYFNAIELLQTYPQIEKFVDWVAKQK